MSRTLTACNRTSASLAKTRPKTVCGWQGGAGGEHVSCVRVAWVVYRVLQTSCGCTAGQEGWDYQAGRVGGAARCILQAAQSVAGYGRRSALQVCLLE